MDGEAQRRITAFWSRIAGEYEAHPGNVPARDSAEYGAWVDAIRELLPTAPADVLDIATGTGFVALIAAALGHRVTALDASKPMLTEARREAALRRLDVAFVDADAVAPNLRAESFDAIVSRHFIWTLREPERAFRAWHGLLRPGGRVVAIDGCWFEDADDDEETGLFAEHYTAETRAALPNMRMASPEPVARMLESAGFMHVTLDRLEQVHALAEDPPSPEPWYVLVGHRGQ
jgi:SAM-dependent methyltransferase